MAERILITGATGFVGRRLVSRLMQEGRHLTLAVRSPRAIPPHWREQPRLRIVSTGPIEDSHNLEDALVDVSGVVHLAGLTNQREESERDFLRANAEATEKLANSSTDITNFVYLSSLFAITKNTASEVIDDHTTGKPLNFYSKSKRMGEEHVSRLSQRGIFAVSLRPPLIVGAEAKGNWAALQRLAATGFPLPFKGVNNRRSMIGVDTLVDAIVHLCSNSWPTDRSGNYCIADPEPVSLAEVVAELRKGMGLSPRLFAVPDAVLRPVAKIALKRRAEGLLGSLEVNSRRFMQRFDFPLTSRVREEIRLSGQEYRALRSNKG